VVDQWDRQRGATESNRNADECQVSDTLSESIGFTKSVGIPVKEGEQNYVNDG